MIKNEENKQSVELNRIKNEEEIQRPDAPVVMIKNKEEEDMAIDTVIDFIAGSAGGIAVVYVGQPFDTAKVKMQTFPHIYPSTWQCIRKIVMSDGIRRGLYAGTTPALAANVAENSVLFCGYGVCQKLITTIMEKEELTAFENACAGFGAAFFSSFTLCPTELIKCKLQALRETGKTQVGAFALTRNILKTEGIPGMYRGLTSTMFREMPGYFFFFGGYEFTKSLLTDSDDDEEIGLINTTIAGGVGGTCLWAAIFPFDVAKSRIQIESSRQSMVSCLRTIFAQEGIQGLYRGLTPTLLRTFPATGVLFVAYEYTKMFFESLLKRP